jgi:hypothetical protein
MEITVDSRTSDEIELELNTWMAKLDFQLRRMSTRNITFPRENEIRKFISFCNDTSNALQSLTSNIINNSSSLESIKLHYHKKVVENRKWLVDLLHRSTENYSISELWIASFDMRYKRMRKLRGEIDRGDFDALSKLTGMSESLITSLHFYMIIFKHIEMNQYISILNRLVSPKIRERCYSLLFKKETPFWVSMEDLKILDPKFERVVFTKYLTYLFGGLGGLIHSILVRSKHTAPFNKDEYANISSILGDYLSVLHQVLKDDAEPENVSSRILDFLGKVDKSRSLIESWELTPTDWLLLIDPLKDVARKMALASVTIEEKVKSEFSIAIQENKDTITRIADSLKVSTDFINGFIRTLVNCDIYLLRKTINNLRASSPDAVYTKRIPPLSSYDKITTKRIIELESLTPRYSENVLLLFQIHMSDIIDIYGSRSEDLKFFKEINMIIEDDGEEQQIKKVPGLIKRFEKIVKRIST